MRGQIHYIKGNDRIQIVTDELIHFYIIDKDTFLPSLENVIYNSMKCSNMMIGSRVRFCITYKQNQKGFQIFTRKYYHNFKVIMDDSNYGGALGNNLSSINAFVMTHKTDICIIDNKDFSLLRQKIEIPF